MKQVFSTTVSHGAQFKGEAAAIEYLHDNAMTDTPVLAAASRALKELMPVHLRWLDAEQARGTIGSEVVIATIDIIVSLAVTTVINHARDPERAGRAVELLSRRLRERLADSADVVRNRLAP